MKLLTRGNPKLMKGEKKGYLSFVLHLAPADMSGWNVCPKATQGCIASCLNTAGRGGIPNAKPTTVTGRYGEIVVPNKIQAARIKRTTLYFAERDRFMEMLSIEIAAGVKYAEKHNLIPVFRLNGTSDIRWESVRVEGFGWKNIMEVFPTVQFYDYTKIANRRLLPSNYHLTFSLAEDNDAEAVYALDRGMSVAAVFRKELPTQYLGRDVVNGDDTDLRFLDPKSVIVGLKAKGKAKRDTSGFVRAAA